MKIIAIGMNYSLHCHELHAGEALPQEPVIFMKPDSALLKDSKPFFIPDFCEQVDYETEMVVRICRLGKNISERFAHRYYDAVTVGIDFTARDLQRKFRAEGKPWELCKGFDSSAAIGDWEALYSTPILHPSHDFEHLLSGWWQLMKWTITNESPMQKELVANSVRNLYIVIDSALNQSGMSVFHNKCSHSRMLINRFFKLLSIHCHETRDVKFYAEQLSITPTYLYKIVRKYMSQSPKELIDKQAISEIKSLLINSDMPIKSIASTLHFEDVSSWSDSCFPLFKDTKSFSIFKYHLSL